MSDLPASVQTQLRSAMDKAANQPEGVAPLLSVPQFNLPGDLRGKAVEAIDQVTGALDAVLKFAWLIPDQYEAPLTKLKEVLAKVRTWLD